MKNIPTNIKYIVYGISCLTFFSLSFYLAPILVSKMIKLLSKLTSYYFGISTSFLDYLLIASIPVFGLFYNSTRTEFRKSQLIQDILTVLLCVLIVFGIGLFLMTYIGTNSNPLIPQYLLMEPFNLYSTLLLGIGIIIPFIFLKKQEKFT